MLSKRSVTIAGHRTSISLEEPFWRHLKRLAEADGMSLAALVRSVDTARAGETDPPNLSSALRVYVLARLEGEHEPTP
ncbi:MAG: ribbon-helix-helix domain-containing protein [Azospirillaceae bacterium]